MDVGGWLRGLGLEQYEAAFRENEIDGEVLPELTEGDLEKLGSRWGTASDFSKLSRHWASPRPLRRARCRVQIRTRTTPSAANSALCSAIL